MDTALRAFVQTRAQDRCEYCQLPQLYCEARHHIEHILARQHGGFSDQENLALACHYCNQHKGPNLAAIDPQTRSLTRLFHPRRDVWSEHFKREGLLIVGLTEVGRATVQLLGFNHDRPLEMRSAMEPPE